MASGTVDEEIHAVWLNSNDLLLLNRAKRQTSH